jgi:hypothetical protein
MRRPHGIRRGRGIRPALIRRRERGEAAMKGRHGAGNLGGRGGSRPHIGAVIRKLASTVLGHEPR